MIVVIDIKVLTNSGFSKFALDKNSCILAYLKSLPEKGKANKELIKNLSKKLKIPQSYIDIIKGETCKYKKIKIESYLNKSEILSNLGLEIQRSFV